MNPPDDWIAVHEITELISRYNRAVDDRSLGGLSELFAQDGVLETMGQRLTGHAEIAAVLADGDQSTTGRPLTAHHLSNVLVQVAGATATAESDFLVVRRTQYGVEPVMAGRYIDRFRRDGGTWRFAYRRTESLARSNA